MEARPSLRAGNAVGVRTRGSASRTKPRGTTKGADTCVINAPFQAFKVKVLSAAGDSDPVGATAFNRVSTDRAIIQVT